MTKTHLLLLGTLGCHLCEQATALLSNCNALANIDIQPVDIAEQTEWQAQFAIRIPVLFHPETHTYIGWPFDHADVTTFIENLNHD